MRDVSDAAVTKKKSRPRGPTKGIRSKPGIQRVLAWDEWIRPIGRYASEYKIYCGEISRSKVSILYDTWDDVPEGTKNTLWEDAKREFGIEEDVLKKRDVLTTCDKRWRDFKSRLVTRWITKTRKVANDDRQPYVMYPYITREIWDQFVKKCSTKEFQAKSAKARISQAANKHPHFLGQKSYAEMIPIWQSRGYIPSATASSVDSSTSSLTTSLPDRTLPWLLARSKKDKDGKLFFPNEETQKIKESIDDWKKKEAEGEFVPGRMDDALSRALQRKD
ncbi:uncharacterized protein LOC104902486 [Beta vulgaris subsp. vulgaris]|uniref:uncharacterized protein LOC104902486 n=1 Tax=Beta vulgaris subsp. vulgaris TaxID=3555 RepID=UPI0025481CFD|nr:uncharacterized protein LOC104902486 [Beta vulgaris subsp. vulgaris]